jgi:predicted GNAT family acetyltransferase
VITVSRNDELSRYEGRADDEIVSVMDYYRHGDVLTITHTGTQPASRGRGLAGELTEKALADVRAQGWRVHPVCPFTVEYLDAHPEHDDLRV